METVGRKGRPGRRNIGYPDFMGRNCMNGQYDSAQQKESRLYEFGVMFTNE